MQAAPPNSSSITRACGMCISPSPSRAMVISTIAAPNSTKPRVSKRTRSGPLRSGMKRSAAIQPITPTGRLIRKIQCQEAYSTSQPPRVGPSSGPTSPGNAMKAMIRTNSLRGKARSTTSRPTGSISAPPSACSTRDATSWLKLVDSAQSSEPRENSTMAATKIRRLPKRSAIQPDAGINKATVSM